MTPPAGTACSTYDFQPAAGADFFSIPPGEPLLKTVFRFPPAFPLKKTTKPRIFKHKNHDF